MPISVTFSDDIYIINNQILLFYYALSAQISFCPQNAKSCYPIINLSKIAIAILDFSLLLLIAFYLICFIFGKISLFLSFIFLSIVIAIVVAIFGRAINIQKAIQNQCTKKCKERSKEVKSDNFCCLKFRRAITKWGAKEKSPILLSKQ